MCLFFIHIFVEISTKLSVLVCSILRCFALFCFIFPTHFPRINVFDILVVNLGAESFKMGTPNEEHFSIASRIAREMSNLHVVQKNQSSTGGSNSNKSTNAGDFWDEMKQAGLASGGEEYWSRGQVDKAKEIHSRYALRNGAAWNNLQKVHARDNTLLAEERLQESEERLLESGERLNEILGAMAEMQAAQAEALSKKLPYQQPMSNAATAYDASQASTAQKQLMRRGLLSLTRWSNGNSSMGGVAGKASNLGATL